MRQAAKALSIPERILRSFLEVEHIIFEQPAGHWVGYAAYTAAGYLGHHVTHSPGKDNHLAVLFTSKGLTWLHRRWAKAQQRLRDRSAGDLATFLAQFSTPED